MHTILLIAGGLLLWLDLTLAALGKRSASYWLCLAGLAAWLWLAARLAGNDQTPAAESPEEWRNAA